MTKKKPCRICGKWFWPNPRAGARQKVCSAPTCQRERHRRACAQWHKKNPQYDKENRLREKIAPNVMASNEKGALPSKHLESVARDVVELQTFVFIDEILKHLRFWMRDEITRQLPVNKEEIGRVLLVAHETR